MTNPDHNPLSFACLACAGLGDHPDEPTSRCAFCDGVGTHEAALSNGSGYADVFLRDRVILLPASHVDHGLSAEQLRWLVERANERLLDEAVPGQVWVAGFELPADLGTVPCGLHGPATGDFDPVPEREVRYAVRGTRKGPSRLCARPVRPTRQATLIAGPHAGAPWVLYTAFGGPSAPREPFELPEGSEERAASEAFWSAHALAEEAAL